MVGKKKLRYNFCFGTQQDTYYLCCFVTTYMFIGEMLYPVDRLCLTWTRARAGEAPAAAGLQELPLAQKQRLHHLSLWREEIVFRSRYSVLQFMPACGRGRLVQRSCGGSKPTVWRGGDCTLPPPGAPIPWETGAWWRSWQNWGHL